MDNIPDYSSNSPVSLESNSSEFIDSTCPVCACSLKDSEELHLCETCETPHHKDCWDYTGGCAIFGCRKGVLRKFEEDRRRDYFLTSFNLKVMSLWGKMVHFDLACFLLCGYSLLLLLLEASLIVVMASIAAFVPFVGLVGSFLSPFWSILWLINIPLLFLLVAGSAGLCLTWLPDKIMRIHFYMLSISVSSKKMDSACQIASRVELPHTFVDYGNYVHKLAKKLTLQVLKIVAILSALAMIPVFQTLEFSAVFMGGILNCAFLSFVCFNCIPGTQVEMERRLTYITSFQNRLIASAKASKGH